MVNDSDGETSEQPKKMGSSGVETSENPPKKVNSSDPTIVEQPAQASPAAAVPPPEADVESQASLTEISSILRRWKKENLLNKGSLFLRGGTLFFSFLAFVIMASNKHGDWEDFDKYQEYRYCLAISILAIMYCGAQVFHQVNRIRTGKDFISQPKAFILEFFGDQIMAYLLISATSAAIPMTNHMREGADNIFTDSSASAISMTFFAFLTLALSALISGFKLSNQNYF
ncbi:hypothetical protein C5167_045273 [Papaver somniferum]|uniref:CASP-like protein n=1 Tax=Papaver somniferum TaxID=3469 RepID=A0A4Y7LCR8_PAPSO|nr:CASP-like protein 4B1 [Papaver somniferum]RZC82482.1 hypothetical protein C5167_045273 [Papaver somniferum]